jgi:hypothetical protein
MLYRRLPKPRPRKRKMMRRKRLLALTTTMRVRKSRPPPPLRPTRRPLEHQFNTCLLSRLLEVIMLVIDMLFFAATRS